MGFTTVHNDECGGTWLPEVRFVHLQGKIKVMHIIEIPNESIQLKNKVVPKHVVISNDKIVYVGTEPQCHRWVKYNK